MELEPFLIVGQIALGAFAIIYRKQLAQRFATKSPGMRLFDHPTAFAWLGGLFICGGLLTALA